MIQNSQPHNFIVFHPSHQFKDLNPSPQSPSYFELKMDGCPSIFVSWVGHVEKSLANKHTFSMSNKLLELCNLVASEIVELIPIIENRLQIKPSLVISTKSQSDYIAISTNAGLLEGCLLGQISCIQIDIPFFIYINKHDGFELEARAENNGLGEGECFRIGINTELTILPPNDIIAEEYLPEEENTFLWISKSSSPLSINSSLLVNIDYLIERGLLLDPKFEGLVEIKDALILTEIGETICDTILLEPSNKVSRYNVCTTKKYEGSLLLIEASSRTISTSNIEEFSSIKLVVKGFPSELVEVQRMLELLFEKHFSKMNYFVLAQGEYFLEEIQLNISFYLGSEDNPLILSKDRLKDFLNCIEYSPIELYNVLEREYWSDVFAIPREYQFYQDYCTELKTSCISECRKNQVFNFLVSRPGEMNLVLKNIIEDKPLNSYAQLSLELDNFKKENLSSLDNSSIAERLQTVRQTATHSSMNQHGIMIFITGDIEEHKKDEEKSAGEYWALQYLNSSILRFVCVLMIRLMREIVKMFKSKSIIVFRESTSKNPLPAYLPDERDFNFKNFDLVGSYEEEASKFTDAYLSSYAKFQDGAPPKGIS